MSCLVRRCGRSASSDVSDSCFFCHCCKPLTRPVVLGGGGFPRVSGAGDAGLKNPMLVLGVQRPESKDLVFSSEAKQLLILRRLSLRRTRVHLYALRGVLLAFKRSNHRYLTADGEIVGNVE